MVDALEPNRNGSGTCAPDLHHDHGFTHVVDGGLDMHLSDVHDRPHGVLTLQRSGPRGDDGLLDERLVHIFADPAGKLLKVACSRNHLDHAACEIDEKRFWVGQICRVRSEKCELAVGIGGAATGRTGGRRGGMLVGSCDIAFTHLCSAQAVERPWLGRFAIAGP